MIERQAENIDLEGTESGSDHHAVEPVHDRLDAPPEDGHRLLLEGVGRGRPHRFQQRLLHDPPELLLGRSAADVGPNFDGPGPVEVVFVEQEPAHGRYVVVELQHTVGLHETKGFVERGLHQVLISQ